MIQMTDTYACLVLPLFLDYLPCHATHRRYVVSILRLLPIGSVSRSHLTCYLPCPDFHQIPRYVIIVQDRAPAFEPAVCFRALRRRLMRALKRGGASCIMTSLHIVRHTGCTSCRLSPRFLGIISQTLRKTPCRQGANHSRCLCCRDWEGPIL